MQQQHLSDYQYSNHRPAIPGDDDFQILENLKEMIKNGQHELFRSIPQPAALAGVYLGSVEPTIQSHYSKASFAPVTPTSSSHADPVSSSESRRNSDMVWETTNGHKPTTPLESKQSYTNGVVNKSDTVGSSGQRSNNLPHLSHANDSSVAQQQSKPVLSLEPNNSAKGRERVSGLSLRDAPPLGDDRQDPEPRGSPEETDRLDSLPLKDQRPLDREREREREKEREFQARDNRRSIARPPPEERHYEPSYDRPRRLEDRPDFYPSVGPRHFENSPESRRPPLADRHYRPDERTSSTPAYDPVPIADRHYRPDDRLHFDSVTKAQSSHAEVAAIRSSPPDTKPKPLDLHPTIGVSKVAELAAASRKAQTTRGSPEERASKPSLIERLNPPPSLQDRISDPPVLSTSIPENRPVKPLEDRLAPRGSSLVPSTRSDERSSTRPLNGTSSLAPRSPPPDRVRGAIDTQVSPSQSVDRVRIDERPMVRSADNHARPQAVDRGPLMPTRSGYSHDTSPTRGYRVPPADRDVRTGNSYRPDMEKGVYERNDFIEADRYNPSHPYLKRGLSPTPERGRPIHSTASGQSGPAPLPREGPVSYDRRLSPSRERRDWDSYGSTYSADRSWRSEHEYRRPYDSRGAPPPAEKERYERDPPPVTSRAGTWEPRDTRPPNNYRPKSPVRTAYDSSTRINEPYAPPPPLSAPAGVSDRVPSFSMQRDVHRYPGTDATATRVRPRSPSPDLRRRPEADDLRPPPKRVREDSYGAPNSYYPPPHRPSDYNAQSPPVSSSSYYSPSGDRDFVRDRPSMSYPPPGNYDRRSPGPPASRLGDYPSRSYDRPPRDERRYNNMGPPPRTG